MTLSRTTICALTFATGLMAGNAGATLDISQQPLILGGFVEPNVLFILDDSGSMHWETMPDELTSHFGSTTGTNSAVQLTFPITLGVHGAGDYGARRVPRFTGNVAARFRSPHNNTVYYNPAITYRPWIQADGTFMPDAPPNAAWHNPVNTGLGTRNLTANQWGQANWVNNDGSHTEGWNNFYPAVYYHYLGTGNIGQESSYERVEIVHPGPSYSGHGRENRTEDGCSNGACSSEAEMQNFANWYSYHRNRIFAARAGIGRAFSEQGEKMRVGYGTINTTAHDVDGQSTQTVIHGVRRFDQQTRTNFFTELYERAIPPQGTPLREALQGAGQYYQRADSRGPWSDTPGTPGGEDLECRQSYTVLMTDGYWNQGNPTFTPVGNVDGTAGPNGYTPANPFQDNHSDTLADVALHYWASDLRPLLGDRVPTSQLNPANWQHMVTFGVGLGVEGTVDPDQAFAAILSGDPPVPSWPEPSSSGTLANIDDLLHAGVNSRGGFFSAMDANEFSRQLSGVLQQILARAGAVTAFSVSSSRIDTDSLVFQAEFGSDPWWGDIAAINPNNGNLVRKASEAMPAWSSRDIITTTTGVNTVDFAAGNNDLRALVAPEGEENNDALNDAIIEYVAGSDEHEDPDSGFNFRVRGEQCGAEFEDPCAIGDIVNSQLVFSGKRNEGWARLPADEGGGADGYGEYLTTTKQSRPDMIYVGANDGMLHAFNAQATGSDDNPTVSLQETFAYVPRAVLENVHELSAPGYGHRFFVDGHATVADAYLNGNWRTVLVGTLGAGGQALYALDVTTPNSPQVLWEISSADSDFEDLGYNFGRPVVTRLHTGQWAAIFGNGYKSDHNQPSLFVVNLANGSLIDKIEAPLTGDQPASNGLSGPAIALDPITRAHATRAYAGDLDGNVWRFDLVAGTASRLFQDPDNNPIKAEPELAVHAAGGIMVYVGSGKLFETDDAEITADEPVQSFYALRDTGNNTISADDLAEIRVTAEENGRRRITTNATNFESGWHLDLVLENNNVGERVLHRAQVGFGSVLFATFEPSLDLCDGGGLVRLYVLDALSGVGDLDENDMGTVEIPIGAPVAPPIAILPPSYGGITPPGPGYAPGDSSDSVPSLPEPDPNDPDMLRGERDQWCGSVGYWDPVDGQFVPFATLCEGRQVWREIQ